MVTEPWEKPLLFCGGGFHSPAQTTYPRTPSLYWQNASKEERIAKAPTGRPAPFLCPPAA
nr:unnamed protein product [Digitaria exilis]